MLRFYSKMIQPRTQPEGCMTLLVYYVKHELLKHGNSYTITINYDVFYERNHNWDWEWCRGLVLDKTWFGPNILIKHYFEITPVPKLLPVGQLSVLRPRSFGTYVVAKPIFCQSEPQNKNIYNDDTVNISHTIDR